MFLDGYVLSLFDGMSNGQIALNRLGIAPLAYYASEIEKPCITVTQANFPHTIQLGSVTEWRTWDIDWTKVKLVMGGSPCQGFSNAGKRGGTKAILDGVEMVVNSLPMYHAVKSAGGEFLSQSHLFWEFVEIVEFIKTKNPDILFMLENVKMAKNNISMITEALGVEPVFINSALVSAQNRQRYYWCNWSVEQPEDRGIVLADILEADGTGFIKSHGEYKERSEKSQCIDANYHKGADNHGQRTLIMQKGRGNNPGGLRVLDGKAPSMTSNSWEHNNHVVVREKSKCVRSSGRGGYDRHEWDSISDCHYRKLTPIECERLQTVPDNYTDHVSNTQRYKMLGNGWTVDIIAHILKQGLTPASLASNI